MLVGKTMINNLELINNLEKKDAPKGMVKALANLRTEFSIMRRHKEGVRKARAYASQEKLRINFGCGANYKERWVNVDLTDNADLQLDLRESIPLPSASAVLIYSEHFVEHLEYPTDVMHLFAECYRLLRPGGRFSAGVPDTSWPILNYAGVGDGLYLDACRRMKWHPDWCRTFMEHINFHFRQGNQHKFAYDFETLQTALEKSGFVSVKEREFDPSLDSERRRIGTLYVDAIRP
jgi:predicted SAM-dependent methyltransferase